MRIGVDGRAASRFHAERPEVQADVELEREDVALQRDGYAAGGLGEPEEGDRAGEVQLEALLHRHGVAGRERQHLLIQAAEVELEIRLDVE